jgi:hypothetical protein
MCFNDLVLEFKNILTVVSSNGNPEFCKLPCGSLKETDKVGNNLFDFKFKDFI